MNFFETIKANLARCLYFPNQPRLFNATRAMITFAAFLVIVSLFLFPFYEAQSVIEFVRSAYMCNSLLCVYISFLSTVFKTNLIFQFIDSNIGAAVQKREHLMFLFFS